MPEFRPAHSSRRRPRPNKPTPVPIPSTLWATGTRTRPSGYGPIPVLSRAVREFTPSRGVFALAALSSAQARPAAQALHEVLADLANYCPPSQVPAGLVSVLGDDTAADLIIASLLPPLDNPTAPEKLTQLAIDAAEKLCPGGILAVLTRHDHDPHGRLLDPTGAVVAAAQAADLLYLSHIVAAPITGDTIDLRLAPAPDHGHAAGHRLVHLDVSVFLLPGMDVDFPATQSRAA
ncbi:MULTISPECIES: hypothetical protein [unclassified Nocardia]|uniref:hypothetical protein n=1 Tax=unclassified Nocardia TaxID=2637762 RepID=UPI00278C4FE5|nr:MULTISPECIES: hypothetical protein [unclassified Nocardia]